MINNKKNEYITLCIIFVITYLSSSVLIVDNVYAFSKLQSGLDTLANSHLLPLAKAISVVAFVACAIMAHLKPEVWISRLGMTFALVVVTHTGVGIIEVLSQTFS